MVVGGPVPLLQHELVLGAAHELPFGRSARRSSRAQGTLELALGAIQLAGPHVIKGLSPGQISDEQVPDHAVPHVQVTAGESHPNVQHLLVFFYRWEILVLILFE